MMSMIGKLELLVGFKKLLIFFAGQHQSSIPPVLVNQAEQRYQPRVRQQQNLQSRSPQKRALSSLQLLSPVLSLPLLWFVSFRYKNIGRCAKHKREQL